MKIYSVSELVREIKESLESSFPEVWVTGETSNLFVSSAGHTYFTLKDEGGQIRAVLFRGALKSLKFHLEEGMELLVYGRLSLYEVRGDLQIVVEHLEPKGIGARELAFEQLKKRLEEEGLFSPERKKPLPLLPRRIGIVTSPKGAVIRDMIHILTRRYPTIQILVYPVAVQGEGAAGEIAAGIRTLDRREDIDLLIVGRGGGSVEDLWAFNEEIVARAITAAKHPIISAVGHETDFTIADFVADLRAPTPSAAAELAVPVTSDLLENLVHTRRRLRQALEKKVDQGRLHVDHLSTRMETLIGHRMKRTADQVVAWRRRLELLNPRSVLKRGYAVASLKGERRPLVRAKETKVGDSLEVMLYEGLLDSKVTRVGK